MTSIARHQSTPKQYEASWSKYAAAHRLGWTWEQPVHQRYRPFDTVGEQLVLAVCGSLILALIVFMA